MRIYNYFKTKRIINLRFWLLFSLIILGLSLLVTGTIYSHTFHPTSQGFFDKTESTIDGLRLTGANLEGDYISFVFVNESPLYWSTRFQQSISDGNNITFRVRTANNYVLSDPNLIAHWSMQNRSGNTVYDIKRTNHLTVSGGVTFGEEYGVVGEGVHFNGVDGRLGTASDTATNYFSFGAWIRAEVPHEIDTQSTSGIGGTSGQRYAFEPENRATNAGAGLSVGTNGISVYEHGDSYMPATAVYSANIGTGWNHIMVVYDNKRAHIYLNGVLVRTGLTSPRSLVYAPRGLGRYGSYGSFLGSMDEVRIYNRALSAAEVRTLYEMGSNFIQWNDWQDEGLIENNVKNEHIISGTSDFFQFKTILKRNESVTSPYLLSYDIELVPTPIISCIVAYKFGFFYNTISDFCGIGLTRNSTAFNVSIGNYSSKAYYNINSTFWSSNLNIKELNWVGANFSNMVDGREVSLQTRTADNYNLSDNSLIAHLSMQDRNGTTIYDLTENNNHGTAVNGVSFGDEYGIVGEGANFDGMDDYIEISNSEEINLTGKAFTISGWIQTDSTGNSGQTDDAFDGYILDLTKWNSLGFASLNNALVWTNIDFSSQFPNTLNRIHLKGNFDIQIDFSNYISSSLSGFRLALRDVATATSGIEVQQRVVSGTQKTYARIDRTPTYNQGSVVNNNHLSGKLRVSRSGSTFTARYWTGSSWATLTPHSTTYTSSGDMYLFIWSIVDSGVLSYTVDNFQLNSGTSTYLSPQTILDKQPTDSHNGLSFRINPSGFLEGYTWNGTEAVVRSNQSINDGTLRHVVWTSDGITQRLFIDGVESSYSVKDNPKINLENNANIRLGRNNLNVKEFDGSIDEVRIYNRSLSADEIKQLYELGSNFIEWNDWQDEGVVEDGIEIINVNSGAGRFFQYRATLNTNDTSVSPYLLNYNINTFESPLDLNITSPLNQEHYNYSVSNLNFTFSGGYKNNCFFSNDSGINFININCSENHISTSFEGLNTWTILINNSLDQSTNKTVNFTVDLTSPLINFSDPTPNNNEGRKDSFLINVTIKELNLANITYFFNNSFTQFMYNGTELINTTILGNGLDSWNLINISNDLFYLLINQSDLLVGEEYLYNVTVYDKAGNYNYTETRLIKGNVAPEIVNVTFSPNLTDYNALDPNQLVNVTVNVSDEIGNFEYIILKWKNSIQDWDDIEVLTNQTINKTNPNFGNITLTEFEFNFTLPEYEDNITIKIRAYDEESEFNEINFTIQSYWDCTWYIEPLELEEVNGFQQDKFIGNITLFNTGDGLYYNNNCTISFSLGYLGFSTNYWNSEIWHSSKRGLEFKTPFILNASSNKTVSISASFPSANIPLSESPKITITSSINDTIDYKKSQQVSTTLLILPEGPYLFQRITSSPSFVYLREGNFTISSYIRNIAGDESINNTAHNVTYYWEIPDLLKNYLSSSLENTFDNISNNSQIDASLTFILDDAIIDKFHDIVRQELNFSMYVYGYSNMTGDLELIEHADGLTLLNISVPIIFNYPPDYTRVIEEKPPEEKPPTPGGGGGAGPSTSIQPMTVSLTQRERLFQTSALYELVRGKDDKFILTVENTFDGPLEDINVRLVGFLSQYLDINPKGTFILQMNESMDFEISVSAPEYFTQGVYDLTFMIEGIVNQSREFETNTVYRFAPIMESRNIELYIQEISREETEDIIYLADDLLEEMIEAGFNTFTIQQLMQDFDQLLNDRKYSDIRDLTDKIKQQRDRAFTSREIMDEVRALIRSANEKGLFAPEAGRILLLAESAFERGDYDLALQRANDAKTTAAMETAGKFNLWFFIKNNAKELAIAFVILCFIIYLISLSVRFALIKHKIKANNEEIKVITELIKETQRECFEKSKLSMDEYKDTIYQYDKMMNKLFNEITELQTKKTHMISLWKGEEKRLFAERELIINHIKEIQLLYIKENKLESHTYDNRMKSYNERLSEIEERLATIDAERRMKHAKV
jgi:hypothetical protein